MDRIPEFFGFHHDLENTLFGYAVFPGQLRHCLRAGVEPIDDLFISVTQFP
jgi:hypothetical protein